MRILFALLCCLPLTLASCAVVDTGDVDTPAGRPPLGERPPLGGDNPPPADQGGGDDVGDGRTDPAEDADGSTPGDDGADDSTSTAADSTDAIADVPTDEADGDSGEASDTSESDGTPADGDGSADGSGDGTGDQDGTPTDSSDSDGSGDDSGTCSAPLLTCGSECVDPREDRENCGQCGVSCRFDQRCFSGNCICEQGHLQCGSTCHDIQSDPAHCGGCNVACGALQVCGNGQCTDNCPDGTSVCGAACVDLQSNDTHCGSCNNGCPGSLTCQDGACGCTGGQTACGDTCRNLQTDPLACGMCGNVCQGDLGCSGGVCTCPSGQTACGNTCRNLLNDIQACGSCGNACGPNQLCVNGTCTCNDGFLDCGGTCVQVSTSDAHCGSCNNACAADRSCSGGQCVCPDGFDDCSGTCADTLHDEDHCGMCNNDCDLGESCFSGTCATCGAGELLCAGGCVDPQSSLAHCGSCGNGCAAGQTCIAGNCGCDNDHLEPNNSAAQATRLPIGNLEPGSGSGAYSHLRICPGDEDWFRLDVPGERGEVVIELTGECSTSGFNPVIEEVNDSGAVQNSAASGGTGGCPRFARRLSRNTRYIRVRAPDGSTGTYNLRVRFDELQERENNNTRTSANGPYHRPAVIHGRLDADWGDSNDFFRFDIRHAGPFTFNTSNCFAWNNIELQNSGGSRIQNGSNSSGCSTVTRSLTPGTYYIRVSARFSNEWGGYRLNFTGSPTFEAEPNNTPATATAIATFPGAGEGALVRNDVDHWRITLPSTTNLVLQTRGPFHDCEADTTIELRSADGATLIAATSAGGSAVNGGTGTCATLRASTHPPLSGLAAGDYIVVVRGTDGAVGPYLLNVHAE